MNHTYAIKVGVLSLLLLLAGPMRGQEEATGSGKPQAAEDGGISLLPSGKLKVSGYIQAQFEYGEKDARLGVGADNEHPDEGFNRIGVRRGRVKLTYEERIVSAVFQVDLTEKGLSLKDVYVNVKDPWWRTNELRAGVLNRPFGYEITHSSSLRESPERSTTFRTLFPQERDLGVNIVLRAPETSPLHILKLEAALVAGNGIQRETDSRKDFIGRLSVASEAGRWLKYGAGISYYNGGVYQGTDSVYRMEGKAFALHADAGNRGRFAKREYFGADAQVAVRSVLGTTQLRGEVLLGTQPGTAGSSQSPNYSVLPANNTYLRRFFGGYAMLVHDIGRTPFAVVAKYDWYDPNVDVRGNEVGLGGTTGTDALQHTVGVGALWHATRNLRLLAYYDFVFFEQTTHLASFSNQEADHFTLRLQYKF